MKATYSIITILILALFGTSCQRDTSDQPAVSFNQPFNVPFGQSVTLPDQSKLIFAQVLNVSPTFRTVSNNREDGTRVKVVLCKPNNQKEDLVLKMGKSIPFGQLGFDGLELQLLDLLSFGSQNESARHSDYVLRLALLNVPRP